MNWRPLGDNVQVEVDLGEKVTAGGIILPETSQKVCNIGRVIAVGSRVRDVAVNNRVIFQRFAGEEMPEKDGGLIKVLMPESDILAAMEE